MLFVRIADEVERKEGEQQEEHVVVFASFLPRRDLSGVRLRIVVVDALVQPVSVGVNVELFKVTELIERVVLQIVDFDHVIFGRLWLIGVAV